MSSAIRPSGRTDVPDILKKIIERKFQEITERSQVSPISLLHEQIYQREATRGFVAALGKKLRSGRSAVIAESKRASPSKGVLRENYRPSEIAQSYERGGAACLSVLTDKDFFQGSEEHLLEAKMSCSLPVIRKDFIIDSYQVLESAALGADCILLIVAALDDDVLAKLHQEAQELGLDVLVEVHDRAELDRALSLDIALVGINNRNLRTFDVTLDTTISLLGEIPDDIVVVTESGILARSDVELMQSNGVNAFLVGEAFMRTDDPGTTLHKLFMPNGPASK